MNANDNWVLATAGVLAGRPVTPSDPLGARLLRLSNLCRMCGGKLGSRQIIALVVEEHQQGNTAATALDRDRREAAEA